MPLRIASASSRGNNIKDICLRIGAIIVVLIVVFTCLIPVISVDARTVEYDSGVFEWIDSDGDVLWSYDLSAHNANHAKIGFIVDEDDATGECYTLTLDFAQDSLATDIGIIYDEYLTLSSKFTTEFNNSGQSKSEFYPSKGIPWSQLSTGSNSGETFQDGKTLEDEASGDFDYYHLITDKSIRLAENASIASIIELGRDHNYDIKSGTTLKAITSNTDAAFKALMVGAVASSYAGAINSVTNASDQAEALLSESFSGQISGWSWDSESNERYDFHDSEGNPISQVNVSEDGTSYFSITGMIYQVCKDISYSVILPVAGIILAFVFAWQIYEAVCERNNMADMGTGFFIQMIVRMCIMILIVLAAWTLTEWVFSLGQWIVNQTSVVVYENFTQGGMMDTINSYVTDEHSADDILTWVLAYKICVNDAIDFGNTLIMLVQGLIINIGMYVVSLIVFVIVYVRLIEMYIQCALAPIPLATMANRTWNQTALNFIRSVFALALQGFIIYLCIEIFNILIENVIENGLSGVDFTGAMWQVIGYALILVFCLFKSSSISKSVVDAR